MLPDFIILISQHDPEGCSSCLLLQTAMTDLVILIQGPAFPKANSLLKKKMISPFLLICRESFLLTVFIAEIFTIIDSPMCLFLFLLPNPDGIGEHRGDTGHVFRDGCHLSVSSDGHGGRSGVCQLTELQ